MRIAFLNPQGNFDREDSYLTEHPDFGGQLVYVKEVALALGRAGIEVDILTRQIDDAEWRGFSKSVDDFGELEDMVRIIRLPFGGSEFLPKEALWPHLPEFAEQIISFYGDDLPDYCTAHYADGGYSACLLRERSKLGFTFTGHSLGAQKMDKLGANLANWSAIEARFRFSRRIAAERLSMQWADTVITSTHEERMEQYGHRLYEGAIIPADDARFRVIPPGINTVIFNQDVATDDDKSREVVSRQIDHPDTPHVVVSSRPDGKKNIAAVVEAFAHSPALRERARLALFVRGLDDPWSQLDLLRGDEREVLRPILDLIEATDLRSSVSFLNIGSQRQLACAYRQFGRMGSVFALPSLFEPFGLAPIEAAACGLAVAATKNGGPSEIFAGGTGILFDPEHPADIARALLEALGAQASLVERSTEHVRTHYTWEKTAERYLDQIQTNLKTPMTQRPELGLGEPDASKLISAYLGSLN